MGAPSSGPVICEDKLRLLHEHSFALANYDRAKQVLDSFIGVLSGPEYREILAYAEESKSTLEASRAALDRHVREHGC